MRKPIILFFIDKRFNHFSIFTMESKITMNAIKFITLACCVFSLVACSQTPSKKNQSNQAAPPSIQISDEAQQFFRAIKTGDTQAALAYIQSGESLDVQDAFGHTGVFLAVDYGNQRVLNALIQQGTSVNKADKQGWTPLMKAVDKHNTEMVKQLLAANANPNTPSPEGWTALHLTMNHPRSSEQNYVEIAELLIQQGAFLNQTRKDGVSPLYLAVLNNRVGVFNTLLAAKASPNIARADGRTPLMQASYDHRTEMVKALLKAGANPNKTDRNGLSALHYTVNDPNKPQQDYADIAQLLIEQGADVNLRAKKVGSPLLLAVKHNRPEVFVTLLNAKADPGIGTFNNWTPLMQAIQDQNTPMINALIKVQDRLRQERDNVLLKKIHP